MEKELDQLRKEVARMSKSPDIAGMSGGEGAFSPLASPVGPTGSGAAEGGMTSALDLGPPADAQGYNSPKTELGDDSGNGGGGHQRNKSVDAIPLLDGSSGEQKKDR